MPHLYADTLLAPGLGASFQWRHQNAGRSLLALLDPESPVHGALDQAIHRFENTVFDLAPNKPTLIDWANADRTLQDAADERELRLGAAHVFQQSIELLQGMQMMTDRDEDPVRLSAIHHHIGDVLGFIGQRSGSAHYLEQAALSYEQALEIRTEESMPAEWARSTYHTGLVLQCLGVLEDDTGFLKQALDCFKQAVNRIPRDTSAGEWADVMGSIGAVLYQLGTHRRGARTLEQALVAWRNVLSVRIAATDPANAPDGSDRSGATSAIALGIAQNNVAATLQALGEHEEDIGSLEASLPLYEQALASLGGDTYPQVAAMLSANRASARLALAAESDHLDFAEAAIDDFEAVRQVFAETDYRHYHDAARQRVEQARALVESLQV